MFDFIKSHKIFRKHKLELILIALASVIPFISMILYFSDVQPATEKNNIEFQPSTPNTHNPSYFIDISGAVMKPDVYEVTAGARLKDLITRAGGLSDQADASYFARNFNLARLVTDQQKVYVPTAAEVQSGLFSDSLMAQTASAPVTQTTGDELTRISINSATLDELDTLPSIGQVTAKKIIDNRPYSSVEDLVNKKAISQTVFDKIKDYLDL